MTFIVAAVVGGAAISGVSSIVSGSRASRTAERGADRAADTTIQTTEMQLAEISRQFDIQQAYLAPLIQQQYDAGAAVRALLGMPGGPQLGPGTPSADPQSYGQPPNAATFAGDSFGPRDGNFGDFERLPSARPTGGRGDPYNALRQPPPQGPRTAGPQYPTGDSVTRFNRGDEGQFVDPNLDPRSLAGSQRLEGQVRDTLLAPDNFEGDEYRNYITGNQIAAATPELDRRVARAKDVRLADGAAGTGVYGEEFTESPVYEFQVEELGRELDRRDSAGGNYGGRAVMEAMRRRQGLANQEYYRWAGGRERDLGRRAQAESFDISRGDSALEGYENQRISDVGRMDSAFGNYLNRRAGDVSRLDQAVGNADRLDEFDLNRSDRGYYNYLGALTGMAGFGNPTGTAVASSQNAGGQAVNALGNQGGNLANIYGNLASDQASIQYAQGAGFNNAVQSGINNWITLQGLGG